MIKAFETPVEGLINVRRKISQSTKFIDYFVHDMLDYSILNNKVKNFIKEISQFDTIMALEEVVEILEDKVLTISFISHFEL